MKPNPKHKDACVICGEPTFCLNLCSPCYQWDYYWTKKKNAAQRRQYLEQTELRNSRAETIRQFKLRSVK